MEIWFGNAVSRSFIVSFLVCTEWVLFSFQYSGRFQVALEISLISAYTFHMLHRDIENLIRENMDEYPSVTVYGPRQCGKTTLARAMYPDFSYANLEDLNTKRLASDDPYEFFTKFPEPVIIDEIQKVPELLSTVQVRIDESGHKPGQYLITGSQQIKVKAAVAQSLAGRTAVVDMLPLSLKELGYAGISIDRDTQLVSGLMPFLFNEKGRAPSPYYGNYINTYLAKDVAEQNQVHDMIKFGKFMVLLAGRTGQLVNNSAIATDVGVSSTTIDAWMSILEASHIIYILKPWSSSRTSKEVKTPKVYFCDTGIAANLLGITTPAQMARDPLMGNLFENLVVMEAVKAIQNTGGLIRNLFFYRNSNGVEVDLVHEHDGKLDLFEIKSGKALDKGYLKHMKAFCRKYGEEKCTVIYSGEDFQSFEGAEFRNFHSAGLMFENNEKPFRLEF